MSSDRTSGTTLPKDQNMHRVKSERGLNNALDIVISQIQDRKLNAQRRRVFLAFLKSVDFQAISVHEETYKDLITAFRTISKLGSEAERDSVLNIFADILAVRPTDINTITRLLQAETG